MDMQKLKVYCILLNICKSALVLNFFIMSEIHPLSISTQFPKSIFYAPHALKPVSFFQPLEHHYVRAPKHFLRLPLNTRVLEALRSCMKVGALKLER